MKKNKKEDKITITIKGGGLSYRKAVDEATAGKVVEICLMSQASSQVEKTTKEGIVEYMNRHAPRRNSEKILTFAGYLRESLGRDSFSPAEIRNLFRDAAEILPGNFPRDFRLVIKNGWIAKDLAKKGNYYITNTGLRILNNGFSKDLIKEK